ELAVAHDLPVAILRGYNNLAWIAELRDQLDDAEEHRARCIEVATARGDRGFLRSLRSGEVGLHAQRGRWDEAERLLDARPEELADSLVNDADILVPMAAVRSARGDREGLDAILHAAHGGVESADAQVREVCVIAEGLVHAALGAHEPALERLAPLARSTI